MKQLIFTSFLIIIFFTCSFAQSEEPDCPVVRVEGLTLIEINKPLIFRAVFDKDIKNYDIKYEWAVSKGEIIAGQGTATIRAAYSDSLTATVKISGLPEYCYNLASESVYFDLPPQAILLDEFSDSDIKINELKLAAFANKLMGDPNAQGFIKVDFDKGISQNKIKRKFSQIAKRLQSHQIEKEYLTFAIGKKGNNLTQFWLVPAGANLPDCENCKIIKVNDL
jgi:hypothetical protein